MPRKQKKYHFIYKTTNLINGKFYVGMHSTSKLEDGYLGSGKKLWYSLNKYGKENHKIERLEFFDTREELKNREKEIINEDFLKDPSCLNIQLGGNQGWTLLNSDSEVQKQKSLKGNKGKTWLLNNDEEWARKYKKSVSDGVKKTSKVFHCWKGRKHSEETKKKMSNSHRGKNKHNSNFCWVSNETETKKIRKDNLDNYLKHGWIKGRKRLELTR